MSDDEYPVVIYHNPACGTSRNAVAMIEAAGYTPEVVPYLAIGWTKPQLQSLLMEAGATPRDFLRTKGTPAGDLRLLDDGVSDDQILEAMVRDPILVNRPIVVTPKGVKLCRPSELVFDLLERRPAAFTKEDGETITFGSPGS